MIEVNILRATEDMKLGRYGTFFAGERYFSRNCKLGRQIVVRSQEGYWIPVEGYRGKFERSATVYMRNRKRLNEFRNPIHYFREREFRERFSFMSFVYSDLFLYQ